MRTRDNWLLDDPDFDDASDEAISPELRMVRDEPRDDQGFRSLLEDPEACLEWAGSER